MNDSTFWVLFGSVAFSLGFLVMAVGSMLLEERDRREAQKRRRRRMRAQRRRREI